MMVLGWDIYVGWNLGDWRRFEGFFEDFRGGWVWLGDGGLGWLEGVGFGVFK